MKQSTSGSRPSVAKKSFMRPKVSKKESEEFGPGKTDIIFCGECGIVYFNKSWHHNLRNYKFLNEEKRVGFRLCPACQMQKDRRYEGEIRVASVAKSDAQSLEEFVRALSRKAYEIDPLTRILKVALKGNVFSIFTSDNQFTQRLAKKMKETHKKLFTAPEIHKGKDGDFFIIMMQYLK
jgi:hypothetical protein